MPELTNTLDFNHIIHQSHNIVKEFSEKISENAEISQPTPAEESTEKFVHFGLLGNGITAYDVSKINPETNDYPIVAHIEGNGKMTTYEPYYSQLSEQDKNSIANEAARQKEVFQSKWDGLTPEQQYSRIYDAGLSLTGDAFHAFLDDNASMEDKIAKYTRSLIFEDEPFPMPEPMEEKENDKKK
ncbi:MAG: hypothetical protein LUF89_08885 [Ruminococcus sp.]|nr:hypothetical protein [Ruminococcus sp.]